MKYKPMLAKPFDERIQIRPGMFVVEEKYDGHRLLVDKSEKGVQTWSRLGNDSARKLSTQLAYELTLLPEGWYDGELMCVKTDAASKSYVVADLDNKEKLVYCIFDMLESFGQNVTGNSFSRRRHTLEGVFDSYSAVYSPKYVTLSTKHVVDSRVDLSTHMARVRAAGGEGLMVKSVNAPYYPGKRSDAFMKMKIVLPACLFITGFEPSTGEKVNRGPYAITLLSDAEGNLCRVKTLDDETCRKIENSPESYMYKSLWIEYSERTPAGAYLNPRWDRLESE